MSFEKSTLDEHPFHDLDESATIPAAQEGQEPKLLNLIQKACEIKDFSFEADGGLGKIPTCFDL